MVNVLNKHKELANGSLRGHVVWAFKHEFDGFLRKSWKDLVIGSGVALVGLFISVSAGLSPRYDWDEHPVLVVLLAILPSSVLVGDIVWRTWKALFGIYKARRADEQFKENVHGVLGIIAGLVIYCAVAAYPIYETYPHLKMVSIGQGSFEQLPELNFPLPTTIVILRSITIKNNGADTYIRPDHWRLSVRTIGGEKLVGHENYVHFGESLDFIYGKLSPIKRGQTVSGAAAFAIAGISPRAISDLGTKLTIYCTDKDGREYAFSLVTRTGG